MFLSPGRSAAAVFMLLAFGLAAQAAESVGDARRIVNSVTGAGVVGNRSLAATDPVYRDEAITAAETSRGELQLQDGSRIIVGENSTISLDDFVVGGSGFKSGTINVAKGAFRFISGGSAKEAIRIKTPLATIGVRGTVLDVYVEPGSGVTRTVLINGRITACNNAGECRTATRACDIILVPSTSEIEQLPFLRSARRSRGEEASLFTLTEDQSRFSRQWRAFEGGCSARAADEVREGLPENATGSNAPPTPPGGGNDDDDDCGEC
ncbi:MAG: FecR domain-containing protein [Pseudomonadota bacterium]|nr:FecR domain-containing protein [Pseudomonadota bacterium]